MDEQLHETRRPHSPTAKRAVAQAVLLMAVGIAPILAFPATTTLGGFRCHNCRSRRPNARIHPSVILGSSDIRFLGHGEHAIVRPGVVLVAPSHEYHHFYRKAAIFVHGMGEDPHGDYVVRGLIIDHPTPFTLKEMILDQDKINRSNSMGDSLLWRGGDKGGDGVILLHNRIELGQPQIGLSGLYQGGWDAALAAADRKDDSSFKIFFNYCEFTEQELENMLQSNDDDGDGWSSVEVDPSFVLDDTWDRGDAWARLRNSIAQVREKKA
jgi:putative AlgH/UPF0301 family transcriptional regulator